MESPEQAEAYDKADFSVSHAERVALFRERAPAHAMQGHILDLGTGSGDILLRFAGAFPRTSYFAVDGSKAMLDLAARRLFHDPEMAERIELAEAFIPSALIPRREYDVIMCHSLLHHLHDPAVLWNTIKELVGEKTFIFVADLRRPDTFSAAQRVVEERSANEHELLKRDFFNSLCAAFTAREIEEQLKSCGMNRLRVEEVGDIHVLVHGMM